METGLAAVKDMGHLFLDCAKWSSHPKGDQLLGGCPCQQHSSLYFEDHIILDASIDLLSTECDMGCCFSNPVDFDGEVTLYHFDLLRAVGKGAFGKVFMSQFAPLCLVCSFLLNRCGSSSISAQKRSMLSNTSTRVVVFDKRL